MTLSRKLRVPRCSSDYSCISRTLPDSAGEDRWVGTRTFRVARVPHMRAALEGINRTTWVLPVS